MNLIVAVTLPQILLFLVITCTDLYKFLPITVVFVCLLHISSLGFAVVYFALACAPCSGFFRGFLAAFLAFYSFSGIHHFTVVFNKIFCCRFSAFQ